MSSTSLAKLSKESLRRELLALMQRELDTSAQSQRTAQAASIHEEAKAEDDKDTRALELSYLARGQAARVSDLQAALVAVETMALHPLRDGATIGVGALVLLEDDDGGRQALFLVPHGAGNKLAKGAVHVATLRSPLGEALIGHRQGDVIEVSRGGALRELTIVEAR